MSSTHPDAAKADESGEAPHASERLSPVAAVLVAVGAVGLVAVMLIDGVAVIGRHAGLPLTGSIEMAQAAVVILASCAIAYATLERAHVAVDLVHRRLGPQMQRHVLRIAALTGFVFMGCLIFSSVWVIAELWTGSERTELLEIPLQPLRLLWVVCASVSAVGFLVQAFRPAVRRGAV